MPQHGAEPHVLLTGANGFVASHILSILVEVSRINNTIDGDVLSLTLQQRGYTVTATVRSETKVNDIIRTHPSWERAVKFVIVADFTSERPFDDIFRNSSKPFDYVIHTASPLKFQVSDIQKEMIEPAEMG